MTITDPNAGATDVLTITITGASGTLAGVGLTGGAGGVYTLTGTAAAVTIALDALSFTPTEGAPGTTSFSSFTLSDASSAYGAPSYPHFSADREVGRLLISVCPLPRTANSESMCQWIALICSA